MKALFRLSASTASSSGDVDPIQIKSTAMVTIAGTESSKLSRLKSAVALIPIIQSGIDDKRLSRERAVSMISFIEWAASTKAEYPVEQQLLNEVFAGLTHLKHALDKG